MNTCPVITSANQVQGAASDLYKALRRYNRLKKQCDSCPTQLDCHAIADADKAIREGLQQLFDEWNAIYDNL